MCSLGREMLGVEQLRNHVDACVPRNIDVLVQEEASQQLLYTGDDGQEMLGDALSQVYILRSASEVKGWGWY